MPMNKDIFWEVFRDTGEPMCWLLSRMEAAAKAGLPPVQTNNKTDGEEAQSSSPFR